MCYRGQAKLVQPLWNTVGHYQLKLNLVYSVTQQFYFCSYFRHRDVLYVHQSTCKNVYSSIICKRQMTSDREIVMHSYRGMPCFNSTEWTLPHVTVCEMNLRNTLHREELEIYTVTKYFGSCKIQTEKKDFGAGSQIFKGEKCSSGWKRA